MAKIFKRAIFLGGLIGFLSACSSLSKSTWAGAGYGAAVGGIAGSLVPGGSSSKPNNIIVGAATGATLGALSGALIHKTMEDHERESFDKGKSEGLLSGSRGRLASTTSGSGSAHYTSPKIERRWVDEEIKGNVLVEGHYEQVIVEEGHWE
ncbi:MAG: hypothetical protein ABL927_04190 [Bdellovibrionales bacterium]